MVEKSTTKIKSVKINTKINNGPSRRHYFIIQG